MRIKGKQLPKPQFNSEARIPLFHSWDQGGKCTKLTCHCHSVGDQWASINAFVKHWAAHVNWFYRSSLKPNCHISSVSSQKDNIVVPHPFLKCADTSPPKLEHISQIKPDNHIVVSRDYLLM